MSWAWIILPSRFDVFRPNWHVVGMNWKGDEVCTEGSICIMESIRWTVDYEEQMNCWEEVAEQTPWNWKWDEADRRIERLFLGHDCTDCRGKKAAMVSIRYFLESRMFLEEQVFFGGINFDPLLTNLFLFPIAGVVAIALSDTCTAPLARITTLSQLGKLRGEGEEERSIWELAAQIVKQEEGGGSYGYAAALWRGNLVAVAHRLTFYGINILLYLGFRAQLMVVE
ncbi:unnamed protein product [Linum tenue]|uniref:Uncharacterized protein n=1 Tax=Linum tenue TaxID=586396 RepID=A0AAV0QRR0_9ROSI|nr:unnamed protein product [Linum tenue]